MKKKLTIALAITTAMALALLFVSSGPAAAAAPHATGPGLVLELEQNPAWEYVGWVGAEYNTPQAELPQVMRTSNQCGPNGYLHCAWTGVNFSGAFYAWNTAWNGTCVPTSGGMNDSITSFWNNMPSFTDYMFIDGGCKNPSGWAGEKHFNSGAFTSDIDCHIGGCWNYNNAISSFRTV